MKTLMTFEQYNNQLNEGWKTNILIGLLSILGVETTMAKNQVPITQQHLTTHTHLKNTADSFIKQGWTLDSTQIDTLYQETQANKPETTISVVRMKFDKNQYFESGKFTLSQEVQDSIRNTMNDISNQQGIITDIVVTSSTDKQGLTHNLQNLLKQMKLTPDNQGLSKARNQSITNFLKSEFNVNDTIITSQENFEQGSGEIDQSARFVSLDIYYLTPVVNTPPAEAPPNKTTKTTYFLSKDTNYKKTQRAGGRNIEIKKLGPIKKYTDRHSYRCSSFK